MDSLTCFQMVGLSLFSRVTLITVRSAKLPRLLSGILKITGMLTMKKVILSKRQAKIPMLMVISTLIK